MFSVGFINRLNVLSDPQISNSSPSFNSNLVEPSRETQAEFLLSHGFLIFTIVDIGIISGLKLRECGASGAIDIN